MFYIILIVAVLMLVWAAYLYLTGSDENIEKAKKIILYSVIALVVAFVASGIPTLVGSFLGQP